jgi:DNA end-binding protein Ku
MSVRPLWKGTLNFGLVSIQVQLLKAVKEHAIGFTLLHEKCDTPISNKRWCEHCHKEIEWTDTVKGLKLPNGSYFVMTQEALKELKPTKTDTIDIVEFIDKGIVPPVFYDTHYYVAPQKETDKAYALFCAALTKYKKAAIGQFVLRDKDAVCLIEPYENALLLTTLNYSYEIVPLEVPKEEASVKITSKELELAHLLIEKLSKKTFNIEQFKDTFVSRLKRAIESKKKGKVVKIEKIAPPHRPSQSLMESLKASLSAHEEKTTGKRGR